MVEEEENESPHVDADETDEEAQDTGPALDNVTIKEDDHVFMTMVRPVDPQHFVCALSTVSRRLAEASTKNSKLKDFHDIVPTPLHAYADVFSETTFDSLPEHRKLSGEPPLTYLPFYSLLMLLSPFYLLPIPFLSSLYPHCIHLYW
jgi:hypothetical protein